MRSPESEPEHRPERDRHLAEEVTDVPSADDTMDPVDECDRLDPTLEHGEQRPLVTLVHRVLARHEPDIRRDAREPFPLDRAESVEEGDLRELVRRHHGGQLRRAAGAAARARAAR